MKKILIAVAMLAGTASLQAQALRTPAPSPNETFKQEFGLGSIEVNYSRPAMKGRKIFGDLVPFDKVWRTGANNATTVTFSDDVKVGGKDVKAGKYGLLTIPGEKEWTIILTKDLNVTSPSAYNQANDVARVTATPATLPFDIESFTIMVGSLKSNSCDLGMMWERTYVGVPVTADVDGKVMKQIDDAMNKDTRPYYAAAAYYYDNGKDMAKAKEWADKAVASNPNAFWMTLLNARICAKMGNKADAKKMCQKTIELATTAKNDDYIKMANELMKTL
jgi:hypothetical protein